MAVTSSQQSKWAQSLRSFLLCSGNRLCQCTHNHQSVFDQVLRCKTNNKWHKHSMQLDTTQGVESKHNVPCLIKIYSFISNADRSKICDFSAICIIPPPPNKLRWEQCFSFLGGNYSYNSQDDWTEKKNNTKQTLKRTSLCLWHDSIALVVWLGSECWSSRVQLQSTSCT